jgi:glutamyl-tRNA synthetase
MHGPPIVGRIAPSPTGLLHLGHARTFLIAWWSIRSQGGSIRLRIEDLDGPRVRPELVDAAQRDLEWIGLDWDGPAELQSAGMDRLRAAVDQLLTSRLAYPCVCSRSDLLSMHSAPQQGERELRYPGTCRGRFSSIDQAEQATGKLAGLRFLVPEGIVSIVDRFAPPLHSDVAAEVGDFLVARRDKLPAYQLAVVVDDGAQGVTEVLRGDDLLPSTARQWLIQEALGLPHPTWVHVPLVLDATGRRFAKRTDALALATLREQGVDPRAVVAWAARTSGQADVDRCTPAEIVPGFDLCRVPHRSVRFTGL